MAQEAELNKIADRYLEDAKIQKNSELPKICNICFEEFAANDMVNIINKCKDVFHHECLK